MSNGNKVDIIIPTYNGRYLLEKNLSHAVKNTKQLGKLIIIDNGSQDDTANWIKKNYPEAIVIHNNTNLGYTIPINQGVSVSDSPYFVLLNNDVRPYPGYLDSALSFFSDPNIFAISFNEDGASWPDLSFGNGKIQYTHGKDKDRPVFSPWASGGSAVFSRKIWNAVGGYDEVYAPWYWEDIDIGYRAWKMGYSIVWDPNAHILHDHESTSKKLNPTYVRRIKERNELMFNWLNITDKHLKRQHFAHLIKYSLSHLGYVRIIILALWQILFHKPIQRKFTRTDSEVLKLISKPYAN